MKIWKTLEEMKILVEKLDNKQALHANLLGFEHPLTKETLEFKSEPTEEMLKIINLIYLLDYTTIYRAVLSNIDPSPVNSIDFIKNKIKNNS